MDAGELVACESGCAHLGAGPEDQVDDPGRQACFSRIRIVIHAERA